MVTPNRDEGITVHDPTSDEERHAVAETCLVRSAIRIPTVMDTIDDTAAKAFGAWPDRLYLLARGGRIALQGGPGPYGFKPEELEAAIVDELAGS